MEADTVAQEDAADRMNFGDRLGELKQKLKQAKDHSEEILLLMGLAHIEIDVVATPLERL